MSDSPPLRAPFRRGPERRSSRDGAAGEPRHDERRTRGIDWIPLFRDAKAAQVEAVLAEAEVVVLPAGEPLLRIGEENRSVYILLSGELAIHFGDEADLANAIRLQPGECVGELSAIDNKPVSALVRAVTPSRLLLLSGEMLWSRLISLRGVARNLMASLTARMRRANEITLRAQREHMELEHLRKELDLARELQSGMLPLQRPLFPGRSDVQVCALIEPASMVGGDLFDVFFVDERRLFFCVGDVSGHGIGAALFMARTIGLLRVLAMNCASPAELLAQVNDRLCEGNETSTFVTLFCGFLDVASGRLAHANGGHCAPLVRTRESTDRLAIAPGMLLGAFPGVSYAAREHTLAPGDTLFVYTDGITEAQDGSGEEFSEARCAALLERARSMPLAESLDFLRLQVAHFTGVSTLADDCTMLVLRRPGLTAALPDQSD